MVVGTKDVAKRWDLPRELLINASPFFAAALKGSFAEATPNEITLPEGSTDAFTLFIQWLYIGEISDTDDDNGLWISKLAYLQAYILGDKLRCLEFSDTVMLELIKYHISMTITSETMRVVFENSASGSKLRRFAIDQFRYHLQKGYIEEGTAAFASAAKVAEDFGLAFLEACVEAGSCDAINPEMCKDRYMEVLMVTEEQ